MDKVSKHQKMLFYIVISISLIGLTIGSFLDLNISKSLVFKDDRIGKVIETFGMVPGFMMINVGGVLLFKGLRKCEKKWAGVLGIVLLVLSFVVSTFLTYKLGIVKAGNTDYGLGTSGFIAIVVGIIASAISTALAFLIKSSKKELLIIIGTAIVLTMIMQYVSIEVLKNLVRRPRYRFLVDPSLNDKGVVFRNWFEFSGIRIKGEGFKSWPSGHSGVIAVLLMLPLLSNFFDERKKTFFIVSAAISMILAFTVASYRIRVGAHFLSDVSTGLLISSSYGLLFTFISLKTYSKFEIK